MSETKRRPALIDLRTVPRHMHEDIVKRNANIEAGATLCGRCTGTGNELLSMWKRCQACGGDGVSKGNEGQFAD